MNAAVTLCPECWTLLYLVRPHQAQVFACATCACDLRVAGGFVETLAFGTSSRIHHLTERSNMQLRFEEQP